MPVIDELGMIAAGDCETGELHLKCAVESRMVHQVDRDRGTELELNLGYTDIHAKRAVPANIYGDRGSLPKPTATIVGIIDGDLRTRRHIEDNGPPKVQRIPLEIIVAHIQRAATLNEEAIAGLGHGARRPIVGVLRL